MPESRRHRILIVDDERDNVELLERVFRREFEVEHALDANEALARIASRRFDVIITDQMMPGMTGIELLRRSLDLSPDSIRIVITGYPDVETAISSVNRGRAFRFFTKPLDREELFNAVTQALRAVDIGAASRRTASELAAVLPTTGEIADGDASSGGSVASRQSLEIEALVAARTMVLTREVERLHERSIEDPDLGVLGARAMRERVEQEVARAERFRLPLSLLAVRVAPAPPPPQTTPPPVSRPLNPFLGPLKSVVDVAQRGGRKYDLIGRATEDAIFILLPHTDDAGAEARAARLMAGLAMSRYPPPRWAHVTRTDENPLTGLWNAALVAVGLASR